MWLPIIICLLFPLLMLQSTLSKSPSMPWRRKPWPRTPSRATTSAHPKLLCGFRFASMFAQGGGVLNLQHGFILILSWSLELVGLRGLLQIYLRTRAGMPAEFLVYSTCSVIELGTCCFRPSLYVRLCAMVSASCWVCWNTMKHRVQARR